MSKERDSELCNAVVVKAEACEGDVLAVPSAEFWAFVNTMQAKVEVSVTLHMARGKVRLTVREPDNADLVPPTEGYTAIG